MSPFSNAFSLSVHFEFFAIFSYCLHFAQFFCLLKRLQRLKQEWQKSPAGTRQTYGKNQVWFGEIERKFAKLLKTIHLLTALPLIYFMIESERACMYSIISGTYVYCLAQIYLWLEVAQIQPWPGQHLPHIVLYSSGSPIDWELIFNYITSPLPPPPPRFHTGKQILQLDMRGLTPHRDFSTLSINYKIM